MLVAPPSDRVYQYLIGFMLFRLPLNPSLPIYNKSMSLNRV